MSSEIGVSNSACRLLLVYPCCIIGADSPHHPPRPTRFSTRNGLKGGKSLGATSDTSIHIIFSITHVLPSPHLSTSRFRKNWVSLCPRMPSHHHTSASAHQCLFHNILPFQGLPLNLRPQAYDFINFFINLPLSIPTM